MCIAKRLLARDVTVHQTEISGVPAKVFAVQLRIIDGHILHFPEGILGGNPGIVNLHVFHILENILAVALQSVHIDVTAEHEGIGSPMQLKVLDADAAATPEHFISIVHCDVFYINLAHLPEHFGSVNHGIFHLQMIRIP